MTALTVEQEHGLACPHSTHCVVSAGPGSGKTLYIVSRVARILREVYKARIYCISFTNEAANVTRKRISSIDDHGRVKSSTIHRFCLMGLNSLSVGQGRQDRLQVVKSDKTLISILSPILHSGVRCSLIRELDEWCSGLPTPVARAAEEDEEETSDEVDEGPQADAIGVEETICLTRLVGLFRLMRRGVIDEAQSSRFKTITTVYQSYFQKLESENIIDLKLIISDFITRFDELRDFVRSTCQYLLIDEFQDLDSEQLRLVRLIADSGVVLTVVGDTNQSIYGWRSLEVDPFGSCASKTTDNFASLTNVLSQTSQVLQYKLATNMRSAREIVRVSNNMMGGVACSKPGPNATGGFACGLICRSPGEELTKVVEIIAHLKSRDEFKSSAVLVRLNSDKVRLLQLLKRSGIPYRCSGNSADSTPCAVKKTKALAAVLTVLLAIRGDEGAIMETLRMCCANKKQIALVMDSITSQQRTSPGSPLTDVFDRIRDHRQPGITGLQCSSIITTCLIRLARIDKAKTIGAKVDDIVALFKLQKTKDVIEFVSQAGRNGTVEQALVSIDEKEADRAKAHTDGIYVGTIHSAKGREWKTVLIPFVNEGVIPCDRGVDVAEERRVLYVGMTRCVESLIMTCCSGNGVRPSRFLLDSGITSTRDLNEVLANYNQLTSV